MIQAYLDESGIHGGAGICVIAGYFGGPSSMKKLGQWWARVLKQYGVEEFHAKEFWAFDEHGNRAARPYRGWPDSKANAFLGSLLEIIENCRKVHPVTSVVVVESFNKLSHNERRFITGGHIVNGKFRSSGCPNKPYFLPFQVVVTDAADHAPVGGKAHFFFDLNKQFKGYALELFTLLKSQETNVANRLGDISFPTGVEAVQLQAADLLCYQTYQYGLKQMQNAREKTGPILNRLLANRLTLTDSLFNDETFPLLMQDVNIPADLR